MPRFPALAPILSCSPTSTEVSSRYGFLIHVPPQFVPLPSGTSLGTREVRLRRTSTPPECGLDNRVLQLHLTEEISGPLKFLKTPNCSVACIQMTPAGKPVRGHKLQQLSPWTVNNKRLSHEESFDINRMPSGLTADTLRSMVSIAKRVTHARQTIHFQRLIKLYRKRNCIRRPLHVLDLNSTFHQPSSGLADRNHIARN